MRLIDANALIEEVQDWVDPFVLTFINNAPTVEPERPRGDLISREALKKTLTSETRDIYEFVCLSRILEKINNAPTVEDRYGEGYQEGYRDGYEKGLKDGEKPQGKWIYQPNHTHLDNVKKYFCPFCRVQVNYPSDTCNNCGADMRGGVKKC